MHGAKKKTKKTKATRKRVLRSFAGAVAFEALSLWWRSGKLGGNIVVRCREGHLFTTIWIPAVSVKALRLGPWRVQRCPVGHHWSLVTPVKESQLTADELHDARAQHDRRLP